MPAPSRAIGSQRNVRIGMKRLYETPKDWHAAADKRLLVFGMSGLGKTHLANLLRGAGDWFHYSIDYRIGTAYMGEHIADNLKREAMKLPFLAELLRSDSIYIGSNITFDNLAPLSTFLGKPGNPDLGGLSIETYVERQSLHRRAEINALLDTPQFIRRAHDLYGYQNFVCDTGGSICEVVDPENPNDEVLSTLAQTTLMVWIEGDDDHRDELIRRFDRAPKPIYYQPEFLHQIWDAYLSNNNMVSGDVNPDAFLRHAYTQVLEHRAPRYAAMAKNWGVRVSARDIALVRDAQDVENLIADALGSPAKTT
jgi:hypothetical protein